MCGVTINGNLTATGRGSMSYTRCGRINLPNNCANVGYGLTTLSVDYLMTPLSTNLALPVLFVSNCIPYKFGAIQTTGYNADTQSTCPTVAAYCNYMGIEFINPGTATCGASQGGAPSNCITPAPSSSAYVPSPTSAFPTGVSSTVQPVCQNSQCGDCKSNMCTKPYGTATCNQATGNWEATGPVEIGDLNLIECGFVITGDLQDTRVGTTYTSTACGWISTTGCVNLFPYGTQFNFDNCYAPILPGVVDNVFNYTCGSGYFRSTTLLHATNFSGVCYASYFDPTDLQLRFSTCPAPVQPRPNQNPPLTPSPPVIIAPNSCSYCPPSMGGPPVPPTPGGPGTNVASSVAVAFTTLALAAAMML